MPSNVEYRELYQHPAPSYFFKMLHPDLRPLADKFVRRLAERLGGDYGVVITATYRSGDAQAELYKSGRGEPGIIRTHNKSGESPHSAVRECAGERVPASRAFDFVIFWHGKSVAEYSAEYKTAGQVADELGLMWGGRGAARHYEPGHIELGRGYQ